MVICPGGGYAHLAPHEGNDYALWLNQHGVTCFVLKYRLGSTAIVIRRCSRTPRAPCAGCGRTRTNYKIDPHRVGIMGSSAGGHLASTVLTHFDSGDTNATDAIERQSSRPDIGILCYPVISMGEFAHQGSKENLLGKNPSPELVKLLSNELQVTTNTPPCFIWTTFEDKTVPMENTTDVRRGVAEKSCAVRSAHLPKRRARHGPGRQTAVRASASVGERLPVLAQGAGLCELKIKPTQLWLDNFFYRSKIKAMKLRVSNHKTIALTLIEVLVVVAILSVLVALLLPALSAARKKAQFITCNGQMKEIGLSAKIWEGDHTNLYPTIVSTSYGGALEYLERGEMFRYFQIMSNILATPKLVICPADIRQPAKDFGPTFSNTNISYFVGLGADDSNPRMLVAGDRNIIGGTKLPSGILEITTNQFIRWSSEMHNGIGNIAIADGSVQQVASSNLFQLLLQTGIATNRLAIP